MLSAMKQSFVNLSRWTYILFQCSTCRCSIYSSGGTQSWRREEKYGEERCNCILAISRCGTISLWFTNADVVDILHFCAHPLIVIFIYSVVAIIPTSYEGFARFPTCILPNRIFVHSTSLQKMPQLWCIHVVYLFIKSHPEGWREAIIVYELTSHSSNIQALISYSMQPGGYFFLVEVTPELASKTLN